MTIKITLKDLDGVYEGIQDSIKSHVDSIDSLLSEEDRESLIESGTESVNEKLKKWIEYGDVTVEFDTEANTARVVPV